VNGYQNLLSRSQLQLLKRTVDLATWSEEEIDKTIENCMRVLDTPEANHRLRLRAVEVIIEIQNQWNDILERALNPPKPSNWGGDRRSEAFRRAREERARLKQEMR
jgi:hypothetical protein